MSKEPLIKSIKINNLLSFGQNDEPFELEPLNILIGPNGSGKSNFIEIFNLLRALPRDLTVPIRRGGGIKEWLFKGKKDIDEASIDVISEYPFGFVPLRYSITLGRSGERVEILDESLENSTKRYSTDDDVYFYYRFYSGKPVLNARESDLQSTGSTIDRAVRHLRREDIHPERSILEQRKDDFQYPEITWCGKQFAGFKMFCDLVIGRDSPIRSPQDTAAPEDFLQEDASNLNLILNNLQGEPRQKIKNRMSRFFEGSGDIRIILSGGTVQLYLEEGYWNTPTHAARLSDGTLRYLALLAILCHPSPPPLICIEEPELGIHPDMILDIAELLKETSKRTQLIVTTHSQTLISAFDDMPSAVVVAEKDERGTRLKRLEPERMNEWLKRYSLGELWESGEIGGNRW